MAGDRGNDVNIGIIILSLLVTLMFIVICCLSYYIYRLRRKIYNGTKILTSEIGSPQTEYIRQISNEDTVKLNKICTFDSPFKQSGILTMVDTDDKEQVKTENNKPITPKPVKRDYMKVGNGKMTMQPVITPDQMNKVCVEVLSKIKRNQSTSLTHLNELMNSKQNDEHTKGERSNLEGNFEEYDVVPKPRKLGSVGNDMDMYDSPPIVLNSTESLDSEAHYDNLPIREDVYQNARLIHGMM